MAVGTPVPNSLSVTIVKVPGSGFRAPENQDESTLVFLPCKRVKQGPAFVWTFDSASRFVKYPKLEIPTPLCF